MRISSLAMTLVAVAALAACGGGSDSSSDSGSSPSTGNQISDLKFLSGTEAPASTVGSDGAFFLDYKSGRLYGPKAGGAWPTASLSLIGPAGPVGPAGAPGTGGTSPGLHSGTTTPAHTLGLDGDFYLNTSSKILYGPKSSGAWPTTGISIVGSLGPTGPTGPAGAPGASLIGGALAPNNSIGADGDFYINTATGTLIGPKASGTWPLTGTSLVGPSGSPGRDGTSILTGAGAPSNALGIDGDLYFDTDNKFIFGPKAGGVWPSTSTSLIGAAGPQGPQGPVGPIGPIGPSGPQGPSGAALRLMDADGVILGLVLTSTRSDVTFQTSTGHQTVINWTGTYPAAQIYYSSFNSGTSTCSGDAYYNSGYSDTNPPIAIYGKWMVYSGSLDSLMVLSQSSQQNDGTALTSAIPAGTLFGFDNPGCRSYNMTSGRQLWPLTKVTPAGVGLPSAIKPPLSIQ